MDEREQKLLFAQLLVKDPSNPFAAAIGVFGKNTSAALEIYREWPTDPLVTEEVARLEKAHGKRAFLPSLEDAARMLLDEAKAARAEGDRKHFVWLMKQFNETMGYIQKPGVTVNNNNQVTRVMEVHKHGDDSDWESQLKTQQEILSRDASQPSIN